MEATVIYPIGQQDFKVLRQDNALYIDKTGFIEKILDEKNRYYFLARPRRFGKSLFLSTLKYFFEGERSLFKGLRIDSYPWSWEKYPVLYIDLNSGEYSDPDNLDIVIDYLFSKWESIYEIGKASDDNTTRFRNIIEKVHEKTGRQVVVLVDEYDKPLVKNSDEEAFETYREKLSALYSNFKTCAPHIKIVFLTGVSRFSKLSVFSGLNNLKDITFSNEFADICGITDKELSTRLQTGIARLSEEYNISPQEACERLKQNYDGYRFSAKGSDIYNPWSILNCMADRKFAFYWNETGFPSIIAKALKKIDANLEEIFDTYCSEKDLKGFDLTNTSPVALMYQTGYLTIKDFDPDMDMYHLGIPNEEVRDGLVNVLLPYYAKYKTDADASKVKDLIKWIKLGNPNKFLEAVQTYFAGVCYKLKIDNENNFQNAFFLLNNLIGLETNAEIDTSDGRIDMTISTPKFIYIIELKYDLSADRALEQINKKNYELRYRGCHQKIFKIGVEFSSKTRTIKDWRIEEAK